MSDAIIAAIGRQLAEALARYGRERSDADKKAVANLQTELCAAVRDEAAEAQAQQIESGESDESK